MISPPREIVLSEGTVRSPCLWLLARRSRRFLAEPWWRRRLAAVRWNSRGRPAGRTALTAAHGAVRFRRSEITARLGGVIALRSTRLARGLVRNLLEIAVARAQLE